MKPTFTNSAERVSYSRRILEKLPSVVTVSDTCLCGASKPLEQDVCNDCFKTAPRPVRTRYNGLARAREEWELARTALFAHARMRRVLKAAASMVALLACAGCVKGKVHPDAGVLGFTFLIAFVIVGGIVGIGCYCHIKHKGDKEIGIADPDEERARKDYQHWGGEL